MGEYQTRRTLIALGCGAMAAAASGPVGAQEATPDFGGQGNFRDLMTVPVMFGAVGPFVFGIDTAANSSVIAEDLLGRVGHRSAAPLMMHTLVGAEPTQAVIVEQISSDEMRYAEARMAVGQRSGMGGLDGLLGSDLLADRRLVLSFRGGRRIRIARSRVPARGFLAPRDPNARLAAPTQAMPQGLIVLKARVGPTRARAVVDTGADITILNSAAAREGRAYPLRARDGSQRMDVQSPTGRATDGALMMLPSLGFSGVNVSGLPVLVGDFHTFGQLGLANEPALLLGVDVLRLFDTVYIDLKRREFYAIA